MTMPLCPFCGASSSRHCDLEEETGGNCPWEEIEDGELVDLPDDEESAADRAYQFRREQEIL